MIGLLFAEIVGVFFVVVLLPFREHFVAVPVAELTEKPVSGLLGRPVAQGSPEHRPLIAQPPQVAHKPENQQSCAADSNSDLGLGEGHLGKFKQGWKKAATLPA